MRSRADSPPAPWAWVALALMVLLVIVVRVRLLNLPLERDEGEYAYIGQLMLEGVPPYEMAYVVKLPGAAAAYALSMALFGQTPTAIHLALMLANLAGILLVFLLARKWFNATVGMIAAATYALMSLSWGVMGNAAHATQFIVPAALGGFLLLLRALESQRLALIFCSGLLFGFAFLLKQPGLIFGIYGGCLLLYSEFQRRPINWSDGVKNALVYGAGAALPFAVLCLIVWRAGVFDRFWFWSFTVAGGGWVSAQQGWTDFTWYCNWTRESGQWLLWLLAGVIVPFVPWMGAVRPVRWPFLGFCAVSILAGAAGLRFNPHYMVLTLPAVAMVIGLGVIEGGQFLGNLRLPRAMATVPVIIFGLDCGYALFAARDFYFTASLDDVMQRVYGPQPFREAAEVARYIKKNSAPESQIAVLGSDPEICFLAQRRSATGHLSTYILMDQRPYSHAMQEEMAREITNAAPEFIVYVDNILSWYPPAQPDNTLLDTMMAYLAAHYRRVGAAVTEPGAGKSVYYWDADVRNIPPHAAPHTSYLFVFKRQPAKP